MKRLFVFLFFFVLLLVVCFVYMEVGSSGISFFGYLLNGGDETSSRIIYIRLIQLFSVFISGASLALSGFVLQRILKNPLIDPGITGVLSGSALGYVVASYLLPSFSTLFLFWKGLFSFLFGLIPGIILVLISLYSKDSIGVVILGVVLNVFISSLVVFVQSFFDPNTLSSVFTWMMGSVGINDFRVVLVYLGIEVFVLIFMIFLSRYIDVLSIGEVDAQVLGVDVRMWRSVFLVISVFLGSISVLLTGIVGFVGFIVPNTLTLLTYRYRILNTRDTVVLNFVLGGVFLVFSHMVAKVIVGGYELPLGVVTGIIGAPIFAVFLTNLIFR